MILINVKMDEYFIFNRKIHGNKVIGFYTDGIMVICSSLTICINEDEIILFTHINEESEITKIAKEKFIPEIFLLHIQIEQAFFKRKKKVKNIDELLLLLDEIMKSKKKQKFINL